MDNIPMGSTREDGNSNGTAEACEAAKELAESYADLLQKKESYRNRLGSFPHYSLDDACYLLTLGAHEDSERVQASGTSDPTARAAADAGKLRNRLNREMDEEYRAEVVEPYLEACEKVDLFHVCLNLLDRRQRHIAEQLYVERRPKKYVTDFKGTHIPRKRLEKEIDEILNQFAFVIQGLKKSGRRTDLYDQEKKKAGKCSLQRGNVP